MELNWSSTNFLERINRRGTQLLSGGSRSDTFASHENRPTAISTRSCKLPPNRKAEKLVPDDWPFVAMSARPSK